jgi:low temperature requirement protein LtrA
MWWTYFGWFQSALEHQLKAFVGRNDARFARDAYSFLHIPLVFGIVAVAVGIEEAVAHPTSPMPPEVLAAFAAGLVLFLSPTVAMWARAGGRLLRARVVAVLALPLAALAVHNQAPVAVFGAAVAVLLALVAVEGRRPPNA